MPIFEYNGKKYNVKDEHIENFMKDFPDASTIMERDGKKYRVRSADYTTFMSQPQQEAKQPEQPAAAPTVPEVETPATPTGETPLTEQDKIRFSAGIEQMKRRTQQSMDDFNERMATMREYHENAPLGGGQTAEGRMMFNPQSGKVEKTYITPLGNRYTSKGLADMESFRYRQAADMSVSGQLRRARLKLAELQAKRNERASEVHDEATEFNNTKLTGLGRALIGGQMYVGMQQSDPEKNALNVAIRQTEELIKDLEEQQDREQGKDVGFWRGFGRIAGDFRTWDFGMSDLSDAMTMMHADQLTDENATEGERAAYNEMMGAIHNKEQAEQAYGGNANFWNRAGMMTGHMPSFMLDFVITGGGFEGVNLLAKGGTKAATKVIGKEVVEEMAEQGFKSYVKNNGIKGFGQYAGNWTIKAMGTMGDDLLVRAPLMTNTVQFGKTTSDIIDRKLGDVVVNEDGTYDFSNDKTWGSAIWQGEANSIIENYSEMFGAHLDPVVTFGNMSKLANVIGAKRIGAVLSKADAGALSGIMGQTHQLFNKMGVSDYFGEVTEEYYGQMWRTMLNLDDAYQQNPDGSRTNLLATGKFHGDIWGGMALSMGLMGAGKHTLTAANYASMKHGVNKADSHATELLGKEVWEAMRATIDLTTNDDMGAMAEAIINDKDFTPDERAAVLTYMERTMMMRGFNLATFAQSRGEQDSDVQSMNESYIDGYNMESSQEMNDAKNMLDYQRQRVSAIVDEDLLAFMDSNPMNALEEVRSNGVWNDEARATILDYLNAKQVYDGMIQRVRDDIDGRIDQSNAMVNARTNRTTGMIQGATMKQDDRRVYVINGNLVQYADGSGIDHNASDESIIVRDAQTGALEQVSPDAVLNIDKALDPYIEKETAAEAIRQQYAQEAANRIDGVVTFNPGDTYTITGDDRQIQVQVVANEQGIVDNGDGTVNVSDGTNVFPLAKETIQQQVDEANLARLAQFEQARAEENAQVIQAEQEANRPQYSLNDVVSLTDENGTTVRGSITADADADGRFEVYTESPINGKRVNLFTRDELDNMLLEHNGVAFERPTVGNNGTENIPENGNNAPQNIPAMQRIPKDEQGNPIYEQADSDTAWDAIVEQTEGDEAMAQTVADAMVSDKEAALKKLEKGKSKGGATPAEKIAAEKERKAAIDAAKQELSIWQKIAGTANRRKMEVEAERRRVAEEAAALRKAEEEKMRAEREEAERIEREALNGVPDMVDDTPQDARARGYRRVSGHKIDRQEPVVGLQGKEITVKFSDSTLPTGRVAVIEAEQLQPSHVQGVRNPLHFIDEAQPKERNDEASVLSARKIAGNIRPEEITSSVTAYTGAPTVNARGEAIQGNNRSDALRLMWESYQEQAAKYKQYLMDHAEEFGLNAEDIAGMQHPVLVNMLDVEDADAITLGQFVAQDTESGGVERIKPKNALQRMGADMRSFANLLLKSADEETSFAGLVDNNGVDVLKWMSQKGYITPTQYRSAFDSKGNLSAEAKNDLRGIMYQSIFKGGSTRLEEMFNAMPAKAQKAILATAFRDYDSPSAERMIEEIQNSIRAYYALSQSADFVNAKTFKDARLAVEGWKIQYQIDDATGESYLPAENFSNFALLLATMYKGENQNIIQGTFNKLYDLIQGTQEENLFEQPDNTPRTLAQAINETLNITYNGQQRSNVLVGDSSASQRGQQGSTGNAATGERIESGERTADSAGSIEAESRTGGEAVHQLQSERKGLEQTLDGEREADSTGMADDATREVLGASNRGDLRVFEEGLDAERRRNTDDSERTRRTAESERLVNIAKQHVMYIPAEVTKTLTGKVPKRTGESVVYIDKEAGKVTKVKDPYAKSAMKSGVQPEDAAFEHLVHNLLFPETEYTFEGISESMGDVRIVLSQKYIPTYGQPTKEQIAEALAARGLFPEDNYSFGNELVSVTDVEGDNVLLGEDGTVYFIDPIIRFKKPLREILAALGGAEQKAPTIGEQVQAAEAEVNTTPTDKQKEAGNYKKGHVQIGTFNVTIEQPRGSVRSGVDKGGKKWEVEMKNTYGYIRGTEGVDGDHIDVFLSNDIDGWNGRQVYVIDQRNADGSFDEHKVMLGFNDINEAEEAYLSNYEQGWQGLGAITGVAIEDFEKWIASSLRKTKAFAEYKSVKTTEGQSASAELDKRQNLANFNVGDVVRDYYDHKLYRIKKHSTNGVSTIAELDAEGNEVRTTTMNAHNNSRYSLAEAPTISQDTDQVSDQVGDAPYSIAPAQYTTKKGKVLDMHLVKFTGELSKEQQRAAKELAKADKGWYDREQGGFMMRSEESAKQLADTIIGNEEAVSEAQPVSMTDIQALNNGDVLFTEPQQVEQTDSEEKSPVWQYSIHVDKETGRTTLRRDDVSGIYPIGDARWQHTAKSPEEMLDILRNPLNGMQDVLEAVGVTLENKIKTRELDRKSKEQAPTAETNPSGNRLVTDERYAELRERMRKKLGGQMNIGIDPEILAIGTEMAVYHLEKGARKFTEFAKAMVADLGDVIRPYLKAFYNGARNLPEVESSEIATDMTSYDEVQTFDIANFDKPGIDAIATAETVTREAEVAQEVEVAQERIKKTRSAKKETKKKTVTSQQSSEIGLFDGLFDNETNNDNGLQRTDAERSEGVSANGNRHEQGLSRGTETSSESEQQDSRRTDNGGKKTGDAVDRTVRPRLSDTVTEKKNTHNNHSERGKDHAPTSVDARIDANIKAIELAKQLLESGEKATEKQMQTLRKFSGWGGLGKAFSEGTYYAPNHIAKQLRELLGEEAYQQAVMSANSAYYTPAYVVDTLWDIAQQMGFKGGNILEGSAGIGNILGQMPTHISERSDIHAIEIDGTSGGILSLLYPDAKVEIQGFEETRIANGSVDLAITNVPFVTGLRVNDTTGDKDLSKKFHNIHDFCIAKNVRKLREGGLGIFITSNGTLDSSKKLRDWIVSEGGADFVGAFRMHNKTFGGTGVTSDIIVIRKRVNGKKSANAIDVSTVTGERMAEYETGETRKVKGKETPVIKQLSMDYNRYFVEHPENMAGEMHFAFEKGDTFRPTSKGLYPKQDKKQEQMLAEFVQSFTAEEFGDKATDSEDVIDAMPGKKIGEVFVKDGKLYINAIGAAQPLEVNANKVKGHTKVECFEAYNAIKEALAEVLEYQINHEDDKGLKPLLAKLNRAYDDFVSTYGHFNKNTAIAFLRNDVDYANVFALEKFEESADAKGNKVQKFGKTDVFSKRVIEKEAEPMPTNVKDGIIASIFKFGRVDVPYIAEQLGKSVAEVKAEIIESGYGFEDPATRQVEVSYQYLSGNVREKLRQAQENNENGEFDRNIKALQEVMPMTIPAHLIDFTLGSSWIEPKMYDEYVKERTEVGVQFTAVGGTWFMNEPYYTNYEKNRAMGVTSEMLGRTVMGHTLIEAAIQNRTITVSTTKKNWDGSTETITDKEATQACSAKIDEIRQDFKEWARQKMQSDAEMSERMERVYNDTFNNYVPMSIPDEFVPEYFGGASHKFKMRSHQGRAIVRGTMQPLLLAHEVGTGKTFTLISTAMEMRRLGTARKPMIVVQNATVGQFVASAKELYPNAKILTLEEADRSAEGRKNFYAKIKYNDWDMIVVPQSTFEFIPDSEERQMTFVQEKIEEKMLVLEQMREADPDGKSMITRQAEREIALLEEELAGLSGETGKKRTANDEKKRAVALQNAEVKAMEMLDRKTDDVENFDDMGIDALLIDEAHEYKHLGFATAMQRGVKGVDPSYSKKSQGVFLKTQAVLEKNNGRNVIFATGTPISNTAAEIWTFMRYLMPADTMKEYGIYYFDDFVRNFGNIQQMLEFTTSGKFKENNRFAGYVNLPELVRIWSGVSDTVLTKEAGGVSDKIPDMEGGKAQDLYLPQTRALRSIMKYVKAELERYDQMSGKQKKENSHIPLTMYGIAKAAAVDARLVQSDAEDDTQSKTNEAVRQTLRSLQESADYKGTVAIFADNYQNKESGFNLYEDIRTKLIAEGVPADEIVVIKSGMTVKKKLEIFEKVNRGEVRVILGSTFTLGTGVNIQERLYTLIHLDAPNRPMDYTQRNGRILRQGNLHKAMGKAVRVLRFGVEDSLDVTAYQRLKTKGAIADSIMNGKQMMANSMTNRVLEEEEDVFGDTVAQLSGSEYAMLKNNAEKNVRKYASRKKQWEADQTYIHNAKPRVKAFIKDAEKRIEDNSRYLEAVRASFPDGKFKEIVIGKHRFAAVEAMEDFFKEHNKSILAEMKQMKDGEIAGEQKRELTIQIGDFSFVVTTKLTRQTMRDGATLFNDVERKMTYSCAALGIEDIPVRQNLLRNAIEDITNNVITGKDFAERLEIAERVKKHNEAELEQLLSREGKPFEYEAELEQAQTQYEEFSELMKKELAEKEAKYAEMDADVTAADNLSSADEADELEREGDGAYTDDEVSFENDPISKVLGKPRFTRKQRREYAERERQRMVARVESLAKKLHLDNVDIVTDASTLQGKKQRSKGFYSKSTGKITIVIPNHRSTFDVEQTLLHEAVAHYGLRKLFGEHFDTFLDNVFNNADEAIRRRIVELATKNGWDFRKATEEYLAMLAENTEFEAAHRTGWWQQIKDFFLNMLHKIGFEDFGGVTLTDNELRYILWRSYENLAEPGRYRSILGEAADVAKQYDLKVGNYAVADNHTPTAAESDDELYRDGDPEIHERELARDRYEKRVKSGMFQSREAMQDSMLGLKEAMHAILGKGTNIEDVDGFENAYLGENRLSSVNKAEADAFAHTLFKPMLDEVAKLAKSEGEREELTDYMMAKHGLERNAYMRNEAIKNGANDADQTDYAGLTALTGMDDVADAEAEAQRMVDDYEQAHDTTDLWEKVNAVSKAILQKSYDCGMMSKETFDKVSDMYEFYIPLRGFDEKTSADAYAYLTYKHSAFNAPIKKAEGRRSKADDPFANLQSMAESAIMQGNRNKLVKQRFLNFALNHPSDLVSVSDIWVEYDAVTDEWKPVFPDNIESTDTPEEVEQKMQDFETKMESLAQQHPDQYKRGKDAIGIPYRIVESRDMRQHQVVVKRGGRDYVITINGNPRAAQALNGQTNPDNDMSGAIGAILRAGEKINRQLSAFYTTRNPDFIVSNFMRDMLYTNSMAWIKESPNYALRFHRNYLMVNPVTMKRLLAKYRKSTLDMSNKTEAMFHQFMMNGGETGYANIRDIEQHKNDIRKELKRANGKLKLARAWSLLAEKFDELNRAVENCARFAAFVTSREMGRSIDRAIYDAKEISVNFNKKGSGAKFYDSVGQTKAGNASALVSGLGRSGYVFWNAAIQGTTNFGRQMKRHPAKAFTGMAAMFLLGAIVAYFGGDDDEDDKNAYYNLPEYVRRSNILFRAGDSWISIPLPIEYRAMYGMGELMTSVLSGKEHLSGGDIAEAIAGQATQILPLDFLEGGGGLNAFVPSAAKPLWEAYVAEKSWTGMPLYKDTPYNKDMPEWTKAYKSTNKYIVGLASAMNEATGGDPYTKGGIDFNPAKVEYMLNGYFGGVFGTIDKLTKTAETIVGEREYDPRSILLVNRLVKAGDERTEYRAVNNEYFRLKEEHDRLKTRLKHYEEDTDNGIFDYAEKIDFLYNSPEYERYEIFEDYRKDIDDLYDELKEAVDDEERKDIEAELNELKKEMISEMEYTRKRK